MPLVLLDFVKVDLLSKASTSRIKFSERCPLAVAILALLFGGWPVLAQEKIQPKVLVIATYESGKDKGDTPGELQYWA